MSTIHPNLHAPDPPAPCSHDADRTSADDGHPHHVPAAKAAWAAAAARAAAAATSQLVPSRRPQRSKHSWFRRLVVTEAKLLAREPMGLLFVFGFPILTVLVISGSFAQDDPGFGGATPADYYLAAYIGVTLTAVGLVMLPVHLASYRERGILRRFRSSQFPSWSLPTAWSVVGSGIAVAGIITLMITDQIVYGLPGPERLGLTVLSIALSIAAFVSIGIFLGLVLPGARAAQAAGLALFFPSFLLGGAGPPPQVMPSAMSTVAELLPTTHAVRAIQSSWLSIGDAPGPHLAVLAGFTLVATLGWIRLAPQARA